MQRQVYWRQQHFCCLLANLGETWVGKITIRSIHVHSTVTDLLPEICSFPTGLATVDCSEEELNVHPVLKKLWRVCYPADLSRAGLFLTGMSVKRGFTLQVLSAPANSFCISLSMVSLWHFLSHLERLSNEKNVLPLIVNMEVKSQSRH